VLVEDLHDGSESRAGYLNEVVQVRREVMRTALPRVAEKRLAGNRRELIAAGTVVAAAQAEEGLVW
jgi:hypothetical protein